MNSGDANEFIYFQCDHELEISERWNILIFNFSYRFNKMNFKKLSVNVILIKLLLIKFINADNKTNYFEEEYNKKPCSIFDTANITAGNKNLDGSITYGNITYASHQYKEYDYIVKGYDEKVKVEPHIRGCICSHRICIRSCCNHDEMIAIIDDKMVCVGIKDKEKYSIFNVTIETSDGIEKSHDLFSDPVYGLSHGKPCSIIILEPLKYPTDKWELKRVIKIILFIVIYNYFIIFKSIGW